MAGETRVPKQIPKFNQYINSTADRLAAINPDTTHTYAVDYGLTTEEADQWKDDRTLWRDTLYIDYSDPLKSTSAVKKKVRDFIPDFSTFAKKPLDKIVLADISGVDEEDIFNIKLERASPSFPTSPIEAECFASIRSIKRGNAKISCRASDDTKRSSIVEGADSIQFSYIIVTSEAAPVIDPDDKSMTKQLSFEAIFNLDLGAENQGKWLVIYFRWFLSRYPQFAGDWSGMQRVVIG
ncbi:MAG: hypothetical protein ABI855_06685 [Bacteroidota bacterium]